MTGTPTTRIATWNLARVRPASWARLPRVLDAMRAVDPDVWVLTETHADVAPGPGYARVATSAEAPDRPEGERWVAVWVRREWPAAELHVDAEAERMAAVRIERPGARPLLVVGTVLPWRDDARHAPLRGGAAFRAALEAQAAEWTRLRREHPDAECCIAGDFNLEVGHRLWTGTAAGRAAFDALLASPGQALACLTGGTSDPLARRGWGASIDHLVVSAGLTVRPHGGMDVFPIRHPLGRTVSDHYGVWADLEDAARP